MHFGHDISGIRRRLGGERGFFFHLECILVSLASLSGIKKGLEKGVERERGYDGIYMEIGCCGCRGVVGPTMWADLIVVGGGFDAQCGMGEWE